MCTNCRILEDFISGGISLAIAMLSLISSDAIGFFYKSSPEKKKFISVPSLTSILHRYLDITALIIVHYQITVSTISKQHPII